ncbi:MAG: SprT-like family protein [Podoviridae sp. ctQNx1]|nr:MAG: SprT-like family protein [Podoviridae sp. ctQNx1]UOF78112.1 sprT-like family protein [Caudoviricetes sp.]
MKMTHEQFVNEIRKVVIQHAHLTEEERKNLETTKLIYGIGQNCIRGLTCYQAWKGENSTVIEIGATAEENWIQLAGTTIHELAHALSGAGVGHSKVWKSNCHRLGLRLAMAAGMEYHLAYLEPNLRRSIAMLPRPDDGIPSFNHRHNLGGIELPKIRPCSAGIGTRGGKSRGTGSGSRLRKYVCSCTPPVIIRASRDDLHAHCDCCGSSFIRA